MCCDVHICGYTLVVCIFVFLCVWYKCRVCMFVWCVCVCLYLCMCICGVYVCVYVRVCVVSVCVYIRMYIHSVYVSVCVCLCICVYRRMVCMFVSPCVWMWCVSLCVWVLCVCSPGVVAAAASIEILGSSLGRWRPCQKPGFSGTPVGRAWCVGGAGTALPWAGVGKPVPSPRLAVGPANRVCGG